MLEAPTEDYHRLHNSPGETRVVVRLCPPPQTLTHPGPSGTQIQEQLKSPKLGLTVLWAHRWLRMQELQNTRTYCCNLHVHQSEAFWDQISAPWKRTVHLPSNDTMWWRTDTWFLAKKCKICGLKGRELPRDAAPQPRSSD